ncbi:TPA: hypothetical protein ACKP7U_001026 [Stenotrophomonas maltophilia]
MRRSAAYVGTAIALLAAAAVATYSMQPTNNLAPQPTSLKNAELEHSSASPVREDLSHLVSRAKIDPKVVIPNRGHAYSISRTQSPPQGDALKYVQSLLQRSRAGDATATYDIYLAVNQCKSALDTPPLSLLQIYRSQGIEEQYKRSLEKNLASCEALLSDPELSYEPWLKRAADQGSIEAKIMFAMDSKSILGNRSDYLSHPERLTNYRIEAMQNLQYAASTGSVDALMALGNAFDNGILTEKSPSQSLAYFKSAYSLAPNPSLQELISRESKSLSSREVEIANRLSIQITNNCCL